MDQVYTDAALMTPYPYSQAIRDDDRVYASGQIGINLETGDFAGDDVQDQAAQTNENGLGSLAKYIDSDTINEAVDRCPSEV